MQCLEHDTRQSGTGDRTERWSSAIETAFGHFAISRLDRQRFGGRLKVERRHDIRFVELEYAGHGFTRRRKDVARLGEAFWTLMRPTHGCLRHGQGGETRVMESGRFYVVNHAVPYDTMPEPNYGTQAIAFPPSSLLSRVAKPADFYALTRPPGSPHGSLLSAFLQHFAANRSTWTDREFECLSSQLLDLVVLTVIEPANASTTGEACMRSAHRQRALQFIRARLAERDLTPQRVADACGIAVSYLHDVFRGSGRTVEETIFAERLEQAHAALVKPELAGLQIATIAYRHGFSDPAHFSRAFRRRFGVTPGDVRAASAARSSGGVPSVKP